MTNLNVSSTQIQLGLCDPPEPIYIYVGQTELDGETSLWYQYDLDAQKQHPIKQRALTGYLSELKITIKEFRGKENPKLDIAVNADQVYVIRSGLETNFSKTLLLALSTLPDLNQPLTIAVTAGEENVVFARLYDATTKVRLKGEWNPDANWFDLVSKIQQRLGQSAPVKELAQIHSVQPGEHVNSDSINSHDSLTQACEQFQPGSSPSALPQTPMAPPALVAPRLSNSDRVKAVRSLTGHSADAVRAILARYDTDHPKNLTPEQCDEVIEILVSYWYQDLNLAVQIPSPEWRSNIQHLQQQGLSEAAAITNWTAQLKLSHPLGVCVNHKKYSESEMNYLAKNSSLNFEY